MKKKVVYSFLISFLLLVAVIIINRNSFINMKEFASATDHTREVITALERLSSHFKSAQIYSPAYASRASKNYYVLYRGEAQSIPWELSRLKALVKDNPDQARRIDTLSNIIQKHYDVLLQNNIAQLIEAGESWRLNEFFAAHALINRSINAEHQLLAIRKAELERSTESISLLTNLFSIIAFILIAITFISNVLLSRRRKWLEGFLESVLNTSQNGIVSYKAVREQGKIVDFRIEFANKAVQHLLGIDPNAVIGKRLGEMPSFVTETDLLKKYIEVTESGQKAELEVFFDRGPVQRWLFVLLAKLNDGLTASFHDITEIKRYQIDLKKNIEQLEHSNSELEQYAYVASHDLQEPLRKIRTYGSQLQDRQSEKLDEKGREYLNKMMSSAERMSVLIKDILSFSSLKREAAFEATDLNAILKNVVQDLELLITQKEAVVNMEQLPVVEAIPLQMHQLFYNLVNNALKFGRTPMPPVITINSRILAAQEVAQHKTLAKHLSYCEVIVRDNGMGFDQRFAEQIFGLFKRLGDKQKADGSGIGLALCRKVVSNHNGLLFAEGKENEGAAFHILLPLKQS